MQGAYPYFNPSMFNLSIMNDQSFNPAMIDLELGYRWDPSKEHVNPFRALCILHKYRGDIWGL